MDPIESTRVTYSWENVSVDVKIYRKSILKRMMGTEEPPITKNILKNGRKKYSANLRDYNYE